jgi:hypothetical protein
LRASWITLPSSGRLPEATNWTSPQGGADQQAFEEIWNLQKSAQGGSGWLLAGNQQVS